MFCTTSNTYQPEGRQARLVNHRTGYEEAGGKEVFQWQRGISPDRVRLDKQRGTGVSPAVFPPTFGRPKVGPPEATPGSGAGEAPGAKA